MCFVYMVIVIVLFNNIMILVFFIFLYYMVNKCFKNFIICFVNLNYKNKV